jgi:hypothetical protein
MDAEVLKLHAHIDQTRSHMRETLRQMPTPEVTALIKVCAGARFDELDEKERLLVGLLAVTCIFELRLNPPEEC